MISKSFLTHVSLQLDKIPDAAVYPFCLPAMQDFAPLKLHSKVTFFIGENGAGKSTLLEAIAVAQGFNAEGGTMNFNFGTRHSHSTLHEYLRLAKGVTRPRDGFFLRAESFYNVATEVENLGAAQYYGGKSLHEQSHGESFFSVMRHRFGGNGLYLLDEPESALSPSRQLAMLSLMHGLVKNNSQFIIATHSPILMAYPNATIYHFGQSGIHPQAYEDTEHVQVTRQFLANPQRMLKALLA
jgi:predicted ATPase